jgi:hypothetical protein
VRRNCLDNTGRCYQFNVVRRLEDIRLERTKRVKEIVAATRKNVSSQEMYKQIEARVNNIAR